MCVQPDTSSLPCKGKVHEKLHFLYFCILACKTRIIGRSCQPLFSSTIQLFWTNLEWWFPRILVSRSLVLPQNAFSHLVIVITVFISPGHGFALLPSLSYFLLRTCFLRLKMPYIFFLFRTSQICDVLSFYKCFTGYKTNVVFPMRFCIYANKERHYGLVILVYPSIHLFVLFNQGTYLDHIWRVDSLGLGDPTILNCPKIPPHLITSTADSIVPVLTSILLSTPFFFYLLNLSFKWSRPQKPINGHRLSVRTAIFFHLKESALGSTARFPQFAEKFFQNQARSFGHSKFESGPKKQSTRLKEEMCSRSPFGM